MNTDRIEKQILLKAPRERVWAAVSQAEQFGSWFGMKVDGPFVPGAQLKASIVPTTVDPEIAKQQEPYVGMAFDFWVVDVEPMQRISFRWHPGAVEPGIDYSKEPTTLIVFEVVEEGGGTRLTITESGFDKIPLARRVAAFASNEGGWEAQTRLIEKYLALHG